jgi:transcriptional regulator with XRE-family HTH domain
MSIKKVTKYVGSELKEARLAMRLTQADVAEKVGADTNYYAKIERGEVVPSLTLLIAVADVLNIDYPQLLPKGSKK